MMPLFVHKVVGIEPDMTVHQKQHVSEFVPNGTGVRYRLQKDGTVASQIAADSKHCPSWFFRLNGHDGMQKFTRECSTVGPLP